MIRVRLRQAAAVERHTGAGNVGIKGTTKSGFPGRKPLGTARIGGPGLPFTGCLMVNE
jgi:hypothetical protein